MKCPDCKKEMKWIEGLLSDAGSRDMTYGRYACDDCRIYMNKQESRGLRIGKGLSLQNEFKDAQAMDKVITDLPGEQQIGFLRAIQHCATCERPNYPETEMEDFCFCKKCKCPYCERNPDKPNRREAKKLIKEMNDENKTID